ncbi:MAG: hypothetical protein RSB84_05345 [Erysipelotrichaceae bacterium]
MKKILNNYRLKYKRQIIMILVIMILLCSPFFILTFGKLRSYVEIKEITRMNADLHQDINEMNTMIDKLTYRFNNEDMRNRSALMDVSKIYGPYDQIGKDKYYIVQLDDSYFMIAKSDGKALLNSKGGIHVTNKHEKEKALAYMSEMKLSDMQTLESDLSDFAYQVDYVGDMPRIQYMLLSFTLLGIVLITIFILYRMFKYSPILRYINRCENLTRQDREIIDYELEAMKKHRGILFGRNYCYFYQGWYRNVIQFVKYEDIVWFYQLENAHNRCSLVLYDKYATKYIIRDFDSEEAYTEALHALQQYAPYASIGWNSEYQRKVKTNFYEFVLLSKKRRSEAEHKKTR